MKGLLNKEINKVKLALTTECNLSCPYCFVKKTNEYMGWDVAKKSVDLLIQSKGRNKLLSMYGGEPLLGFEMIKKICPYAINQAKKKNKKLTISICTNLTLIKKSHIDFINKCGVKLVFSLVGKKCWHDKFRRFDSKIGTHDIVIGKTEMIQKNMDVDNVGVSFCVFPDTAGCLGENFKYILDLGFNHINFEIVREFKPWTKNHIKAFEEEYTKILDQLISNIERGNFLFINPINWEIAYSLLSRSVGTECPFNYKLEVYPNGEITFSPFLFNDENKNIFFVANLKENEQYMFRDCIFSSNKNGCKKCINSYFSPYKSDDGANTVHRIYRNLSVKAAHVILEKSKFDGSFRDYIDKIRNDICF